MAMIFKEGAPLYSVEIEREEGEDVLYINYLKADHAPNIADNADVMARAIDALVDNPNAARIVFVQQRNYNYPFEQVSLLAEIAGLYNFFIKHDELLSPTKLRFFGNIGDIYGEVNYIIGLLKRDPLACYIELNKKITNLRFGVEKKNIVNRENLINYARFLEKIKGMVEATRLIRKLIGFVDEYIIGNREIYSDIFRPDILPNFTFTRLMAQLPKDSEFIDQYEVGKEDEKAIVTILSRKNDSRHFYHIIPMEYSLSDEHHLILNLARNVLTEHRPKAEEFTDLNRTREVFFNISRDLLQELAKNKGIGLSQKELEGLANILVRYTIGFGLIEVLLLDDKLQDIVINAPIGQNNIFVRHSKYDECITNIMPSYEDADSWAAKLRLQSGRPLDEANPVLDSDIVFRNVRARVAAITRPLSPHGLAYAFRRHRDDPWTLPLFIKNKMINSFAAGLLSFLVDNNRTLLVAGTRSSGKTSLLGSLMLEIMSKVRIILVEDTLELPVDAIRKIGYDILRMKVRSALVSGTNELEAAEGIRTSLRLGDSALIIGEVRSEEAKALYEAMRVGALANVVAGTIHGDSPYGVFDRVVNDLNVPATSFKATDIIIVANPVRTADGLHAVRRVVRVTEVRKHWTKDPLLERGFIDLLRYNVETDELEPTDDLINGESEVIKNIAGNVKGWAGNWDAVYDNIILRGKIKKEIVENAEKLGQSKLLEARFCSLSNEIFHKICDKIRLEKGLPLSEFVFPVWKEWFYKEAENWQ